VRCPTCGTEGSTGATSCVACGAPLPEPAPTGDRRVVTALFADLVDYVRMLAEHDPEEVRSRVTAALATMAAAIERVGGTREKFIGDAVFAVFGWPRAHDDDAVRAALAALAIRDGLAGGGPDEALEVRIGIATGEVVAAAGNRAPDGDLRLTGEAITTAARIQSLARPGEILLDDATRQAARGRLATDPRGSVVLRGQSIPVEVHALRGEAGMAAWMPYPSAASGPLVGRRRERSVIEAAIGRVRRTGKGEVIVLAGEAGMGKSRLLEAVAPTARAAGFAWTWTANVSYGRGEPYRWARQFAQAVADEHGTDSGSLVRQLLFTDDLSAAERRRFGGAIAAIARDAAFSGWEQEARDMPNDPTEVAATLVEVASRYLDQLMATTGPRVVVVDDLHWLDPSSAGMVDLLVDRSIDQPWLILAATRADEVPHWGGRVRVRRIDLQGLAEPETARLATLVARAAVDADGARDIHLRTGGNPLFVGETVRAFLEDGTLRWRDGLVALSGRGTSRLPVTLRAVLGARIDALPEAEREVLGVASVIGVTFRPEVVASLIDRPLAPGAFDRLADAALIVRADDGHWQFAHALIHDAAYAGLLASRRRLLHGRVADRLEQRDTPTALGAVAGHRVAAGDVARAVPLLREAAESALGLGAAAEAAAFWRQAAELAESDDPAAAAADRVRADQAVEAIPLLREAAGLDPAASPAPGPS
jgi:class 3 adenylate cyclase